LAESEPDTAIEVIVRGALPLFCTVKVWVALDLPTMVLAKFKMLAPMAAVPAVTRKLWFTEGAAE
jgi:hypothetical protein